MAWNSLGLAALYLGVAAAARDWLVRFLGERTPSALGRPLATLPRFETAVGEIEAALTGADDLVDGLALRVDAGDETVAGHPAIAKLIATRAAIGAVEQAVALVGNNALTRKNPLERHYRDVLCARVHTPQDDSILTAAGRSALAASRTDTNTTGETLMPVEFIGMIHTNDGSESRPQTTPLLDPDFTRRHAQAHEDAGFDRVLIGYGSSWPEGTQVAAHVAAHTERLGLLIAHRPGFVFPTLAARQFATLDQFSGGRVAVHVITGGNDAEQRRDGDYLGKDERYARTDEYLEILRQSWTQAEAFSLDGRFYRFEGYYPGVRPVRPAGIPLFFGGSSAAAYQVGGKHADTFALWGEPLKETAEQIASVRAAAAAAGRPAPGISVSFRPILGATEDLAWERAHRILEAIENPGSRRPGTGAGAARTGSRRTPARSGCWPPRPRATCTTGRCGRPPPGPAGPAATPPPWSGRRTRSPRPCSIMWTSA